MILKDVTLPGVLRLQIGPHFFPFGKQAFLNDLIHIGAGQRQAGAEPTLDLGKVVGTGSLHLTEHRIDVLLRRDDDPGPAHADGAQFFGDGLQIEHQVGDRCR